MGMCLEPSIPQRADLIILETMAMNDAEAVELLLLRLLSHYSGRQASPPAFLLLSTHRMQTLDYDPSECIHGMRFRANFSCCGELERQVSFVPEPPTLLGGEHPGLQAGVMEFYGFGAIDHRAFLAALQRERMGARLNTSFCALLGRIHGDGMHPYNLGRLLFADYLRAYTLGALLQLHAERRAAAAGVAITPSAAVSLLPPETMRVGLQPVAMHCYGFVSIEGSGMFRAPQCVHARCAHSCEALPVGPSFPAPTAADPPLSRILFLYVFAPTCSRPLSLLTVRNYDPQGRGAQGHAAAGRRRLQGLCLFRVPAARQHHAAQARLDRDRARAQHRRSGEHPHHGRLSRQRRAAVRAATAAAAAQRHRAGAWLAAAAGHRLPALLPAHGARECHVRQGLHVFPKHHRRPQLRKDVGPPPA
jgi:hypothetical protein